MTAKPPSDAPKDDSSVEQLLRALAPAFEAELGRILAGHEERLQAESTVRLKAALLEKEAELKTKSEAENARLRGELTERVRNETAKDLEARFEEKLSAELRSLKDRLDLAARQAEATWGEEKRALETETARWRALAGFYRQTGAVVSQTEILGQFLQAAGHFSEAAALYLNKAGGLTRWQGGGDAGVFPDLVSEETRDPDWYWAPITIRSRMVAAVAASGVSNGETLDALVEGLRHAIENIGLRIGARTPTAREPETNAPKDPRSTGRESSVNAPVESDSVMAPGPDGAT